MQYFFFLILSEQATSFLTPGARSDPSARRQLFTSAFKLDF